MCAHSPYFGSSLLRCYRDHTVTWNTRWKMKVNQNNCVSVVNVPEHVAECVDVFHYNPVLDLYAAFSYKDGVSVWDLQSGRVVVRFEDSDEVLHFLLSGYREIALL